MYRCTGLKTSREELRLRVRRATTCICSFQLRGFNQFLRYLCACCQYSFARRLRCRRMCSNEQTQNASLQFTFWLNSVTHNKYNMVRFITARHFLRQMHQTASWTTTPAFTPFSVLIPLKRIARYFSCDYEIRVRIMCARCGLSHAKMAQQFQP